MKQEEVVELVRPEPRFAVIGGEIRKGALRRREKIRAKKEIPVDVACETQFREYDSRRRPKSD